MDEFEHMRAAHLVGLGFHPYKDFFEHHHPLLWWIWAPIIKILPHHQIFLLYFLRTATTLLSCGSAYYIFQIAIRFFGGTKSALLALLSYFSFYFAVEVLITYEYKKQVKVSDRATILNFMVGMNGYTLCSGIICENLNGTDYCAVKLDTDEKMTVGYLVRKNVPISELGKKYIEEISKYKERVMK